MVLIAGVFGAAADYTSAPMSLPQPGIGNSDRAINDKPNFFILTLRTK